MDFMDMYKKDLSKLSIEEALIERRRRKMAKFKGLVSAHRLEKVRVHNDIIFINDAKAENANATYFALQSIRKPIVWLVGGDDAQTDYWDLMSLVRQKVDAIIMIGSQNDKINFTFSPVISEIYEAATMDEAVKLAYKVSKPKSTILLSPAAKADDLYADYEDRGNQFIKAVKRI
jgi:UDP-N-acetylmuramoylalanine--D-glutamate ligase